MFQPTNYSFQYQYCYLNRSFSYFAAFLVGSLFLPAALWAQVPELSTTSEEVVVTGARFTRPLAESPENVTIIDSATVARAADLAQLL
ncbi:MAG: hypothetical protein AB8H12_09550, partial [Lewinella sp.]